jgi:KDO2-lipid IV(A) lauroyltransferase
MKYKSAHIFEYVLLRLMAGLIRILPLRAALGLGWIAAAVSHYIGRVNVERTHKRIHEVFGDRYSEKEIRKIAWISWRNLCFNAIDALRFSMLTPEEVRKQPIGSLEPNFKACLKKHEAGFIIATPHMGNWEIAGVAADLVGIPLFAIARKLKNPLMDDYINNMRSTFNLEILLSGTKIWKSVAERLTMGKVLAILPDINSRAKGVTVDFLNGKATIAPGAARFAQLAECPIYPVVARRIGWTKHDAVLLAPIYPDPALDKAPDQQRMMQELMTALSEEICKTPEQYFWYNKRWVLNAEDRQG